MRPSWRTRRVNQLNGVLRLDFERKSAKYFTPVLGVESYGNDQMRMKICIVLALLGTLCLTGAAANAQYYYPGPAIAHGIVGQAPYAYLPPVYYQAPPIVVQPFGYSPFYSRYNQYAYPSY